MGYSIAKPSLCLSKFVNQYWAIENCSHEKEHYTQRIVPSGMPELIFYLGDRPISKDTSKSINENTIITGHLSKYYDLQISGKLSIFSILFKPHGLCMFFDIPLDELYNQNVPLKYILRQNTSEVESQLQTATSFTERITIIENYLLMLLNKSTQKYSYNRIQHILNIVNYTRGNVKIDLLASEACLSRKQFERDFLQYVGVSPKQFLNTIRFQSVIDQKSRNKSANITDLTYLCGYYDQSHMTNNFQKLTGMTPKQYFLECDSYSDYFQ